MKSKGVFTLLFYIIIAIVLGVVSLFGVDSNKYLSAYNIKQGLDLSGGVSIVYEADKENVTKEEMDSAIALIRQRLDRKGWTEAEVAKQGENRIIVDIPGIEDAQMAINDIGQTAQLTFQDMQGNILLTGAEVIDARKEMRLGENGQYEIFISLEFSEEGKEMFAKATADNIGQQLAIVLDDRVISAPTVSTAITDGKAIITGGFTAEESDEMSSLIRSGSLPFNLDVLQMKNVGAKLGTNALQTSLLAGIIGFLIVIGFMLIVYKALGLAADLALVIYIGLEVVILSAIGTTLTLPGIAGIILSVGMAVDANVVIFERIQEELNIGKSLRSAVDIGFKKALSAILDGNITTLISAGILFWVGTGPVKGFAQTLMIGIIISMFTALIITRFIVKGLIGIGINNPKLYGVKPKIL